MRRIYLDTTQADMCIGVYVNDTEVVPICYIDAEKKCYLIAANGRDFLSNVHQWKEKLTPCTSIEIFDSFEMAQKKYEFLDRVAIEQELRNIEQKSKL